MKKHKLPAFADNWPTIPIPEMRRIMAKYIRPKLGRMPDASTPKSTQICIRDIERLANIDRHTLGMINRGVEDFKAMARIRRRDAFGKVRQKRLSRVLLLIERGYVTKTQYRFYTIHDQPVVKPAPPPMRVAMTAAGPRLAPVAPVRIPPRMPDFASLFGVGLKK